MKKIFILFFLGLACSRENSVDVQPVEEVDNLARAAASTCLTNTVDVNLLVGSCADHLAGFSPLTSGLNYVALSDPLQGSYASFLYADSNIPPTLQTHVGDSIGAMIQPISGKIKVVCEGMSNAKLIFDQLIVKLSQSSLDNPAVQIVDLAQSSWDLNTWVSSGVGTIDPNVQVVLWYHSNNKPQSGCTKVFPNHAEATQAQLEQRLIQVRQKYPNMKQLYVGFREFGGWSCPPSGTDRREPVAFEEGFSVKWFQANHLAQNAPFIGLGPYTWTTSTPRSYFRGDGGHPCAAGASFFAQEWFDFLLNTSTSRFWFAANP